MMALEERAAVPLRLLSLVVRVVALFIREDDIICRCSDLHLFGIGLWEMGVS